MNLPKVVITGRPNVGKSTLFNRLIGGRISIVDDQPGITRDRVSGVCRLDDTTVELFDTGGFGIKKEDALSQEVEKQITYALTDADIVLFVVDVQTGITKLDQALADLLRKIDKPAIIVANKADNQSLELQSSEFYKLGFGDVIPVSALHGYGVSDLIEKIKSTLPEKVEGLVCDSIMKLAIVGARNVGKSTFVNTLVGEERVIVSELPGTTRDAIDVRVEINGRPIILIDTAGMIKKSKIREDVDFYSVVRAEQAIKRADVVLLVIDATVPVGEVTKKLAGFITENYKPCIITINKWDLVDEKVDILKYKEYFEKVLPTLHFAPISATSAIEGANLKETIKLAEELYHQARIRVSTSKLNQFLDRIRKTRPPSAKRKHPPKFYYATQVGTAPPTIVFFVNDPDAFDQNYRKFLTNKMHQLLPFSEVPIKLLIRKSVGRE